MLLAVYIFLLNGLLSDSMSRQSHIAMIEVKGVLPLEPTAWSWLRYSLSDILA